MKNDSTILAIVVFIILGGVTLLGAYYLYTSRPKPASQATPSISEQPVNSSEDVPPANTLDIPQFEWKTYSQSEEGYAFQYPSIWNLKEESKGLTLENPQGKDVFVLRFLKNSYDSIKKKLGNPGVAEGDLNNTPVVIEQDENRVSTYTFATNSDEKVVQITLNGNLTKDELEYSLLQQVMATVHTIN